MSELAIYRAIIDVWLGEHWRRHLPLLHHSSGGRIIRTTDVLMITKPFVVLKHSIGTVDVFL